MATGYGVFAGPDLLQLLPILLDGITGRVAPCCLLS